jgi:thiol-disulfide isomerase/thioredoxin
MKAGKMNKALGLFFVCLIVSGSGHSAVAEITQAELEDFRLIFHEGNELFPFGDLVMPNGELFDGFALRDRYALVTLWSTWCPYCDKENPSIQALYEKYSGDRFTVMTVSLGEDGGTVLGYMEKNGYTFPVALDKGEGLKEKYAPKRPRSYVIDRGGFIIAEIQGGKDWVSEGAIKVLEHVIPGFNADGSGEGSGK